MADMTKTITVAVARAKDAVYAVLDTLDDIEKRTQVLPEDRDRLSARMSKLGEDAWWAEHLMDLALDGPEET